MDNFSIQQSESKLEWHDYFMGTLKAPLPDGAHFLIGMASTGSGVHARFSDGKNWIWSEDFETVDAAKMACNAYFEIYI